MSEPYGVDLWLPEGMLVYGFIVRPVGGDLFEVVEIPTAFEAEAFGYRDTLRLKANTDGTMEIVAVAKGANWQRFDSFVPLGFTASDRGQSLLDSVIENGGAWVLDFGGILSVVLPPACKWSLLEALKTALDLSPERPAS